jgi:Uncharacterized protein conserved in bacteria (DUF2147)
MSPLAACADRLRLAAGAALLVTASALFAVPATASSITGSSTGAWFVDGTGAALQMFNCSCLLCSRIAWLQKASDTVGQRSRDNKNPDPEFRQRLLCGLTFFMDFGRLASTTGVAVRSTTRTTDRHTASRLNALRPMCLSSASMSACHCSVRPRPCSGSRSWAREDAASAVRTGSHVGLDGNNG